MFTIGKNALKNIKKLSEFFLVIYEPSVMLSISERPSGKKNLCLSQAEHLWEDLIGCL